MNETQRAEFAKEMECNFAISVPGNRTSKGHIITVEDPVEYSRQSKLSLITHREVGVDTHSWHHALKNTLRQAPDVIN